MYVFIKRAILANHGMTDGEQFTHDGDDDLFFGFALFFHAFDEFFKSGITTKADHNSRHKKG